MDKYLSYEEKFREFYEIAVDATALKRITQSQANIGNINDIWLAKIYQRVQVLNIFFICFQWGDKKFGDERSPKW